MRSNKYFISQTGINEINQVKHSGPIKIKINIPQTPLHILTVHTILEYKKGNWITKKITTTDYHWHFGEDPLSKQWLWGWVVHKMTLRGGEGGVGVAGWDIALVLKIDY